MTRVVAIILHAVPGADAGPLERAFADARTANAERLARGFRAAGAGEVRIVETRAGGASFGRRLREVEADERGSGLVILGSGSVPLAMLPDLRAFVSAAAADTATVGADGAARAGGGDRGAPVLANNRYSADILAIPRGVARVHLPDLPDVAADNGLPRWLAERGAPVVDLRGRWRLGVDLDSPLDVLLVGRAPLHDTTFAQVRDAAARIRRAGEDGAAELLIAGRTSAATLHWVEGATHSRTRALVEERGMRTAVAGQRPARSSLGLLLDRDGPGALGRILAELADAAVVDSRVLMAHRLGPDDGRWPPAEDRFASDLLLHERVADPWLGALTRAASEAPIPIVLGGHTLVGPGLRLLLGNRR